MQEVRDWVESKNVKKLALVMQMWLKSPEKIQAQLEHVSPVAIQYWAAEADADLTDEQAEQLAPARVWLVSLYSLLRGFQRAPEKKLVLRLVHEDMMLMNDPILASKTYAALLAYFMAFPNSSHHARHEVTKFLGNARVMEMMKNLHPDTMKWVNELRDVLHVTSSHIYLKRLERAKEFKL